MQACWIKENSSKYIQIHIKDPKLLNGTVYCISFCNILEVWGISGWFTRSSDSRDRTLTHWQRCVHRAYTATTETLRDVETTKKSLSFVYKTERAKKKPPRICKNRVSYPFLPLTTSERSFPHSHSSLLWLFVMLWFSATLAVEAVFFYVNLSLSSSQSFFHLLSLLFQAGDKPWRGYRRLEGNVRTEQHAKSNPPAGLSLALSFSDTVCLSFHPRDLARRQTYASELLRTIWASTFCQGMCVGFWRRLTSVTCYYVLLFVWGERHGEGWVIRSPHIDFLFLSESCEAAKWCGFANVCMSFTVF